MVLLLSMMRTIQSRRLSFTTHLFAEPGRWDSRKNRLKGNSPIEKEINNTLITLTTLAWNYYNDCLKNNKNISPEALCDVLMHKDRPNTMLLDAFNCHIANLESRVGFDIALNTVKSIKQQSIKLNSF